MKNEYGHSSPFPFLPFLLPSLPPFLSECNVHFHFTITFRPLSLPRSLSLSPACSHLVHIRMDGGEMEEEEAEEEGGQPTEPFTLHAVC